MEFSANSFMVLPEVAPGIYLFLRCAGFFSVFMLSIGLRAPARIGLAMAFAFTLCLWPLLDAPSGPTSSQTVLGECAIGALLGAQASVLLFCLRIVGSIAAQSTSLAQLLGGASPEPVPAIGYFLLLCGVAFAISQGALVALVAMIARSLFIFPIGQGFAFRDWDYNVLINYTDSLTLALTLASPFCFVSLIYNAAIGFVNRAMPQLMVAFVGTPVITWLSMFLMALTVVGIVETWHIAFSNSLFPRMR